MSGTPTAVIPYFRTFSAPVTVDIGRRLKKMPAQFLIIMHWYGTLQHKNFCINPVAEQLPFISKGICLLINLIK